MENILACICIILQIFVISKCVKVELTYSEGMSDEMLFHTSDKTICSRFNAELVNDDETASGVKCRCRSREIFFGLNNNRPLCLHENFGHSYGKRNNTTTLFDPRNYQCTLE